MNDTVHFEKTLSSETLFEGRVITLTKDTALVENGKTATRELVHHHGGACILPYFADGTICTVSYTHLLLFLGHLAQLDVLLFDQQLQQTALGQHLGVCLDLFVIGFLRCV